MPLTRANRITFTILLTIGFAFCAGTLVAATHTLLFLHRATRTQARFNGAIAHSGYNGGTFLFPQFVFHTADNQEVTLNSKDGSTGQPYTDNQAVPILYDPSNPRNAQLDSFLHLWLATLILSPFALLFTAIPLSVMRSIRRDKTPIRS
jgi:hypothetical protein